MRSRIAIIGTGISGLGAAWALHRDHEITVFEARDRLGGHSHTVDVPLPDGPVPVDTGFIVYNEVTYPHLTRLFRHLGVVTEPSDMSFAFSVEGGLEYGASLRGLLAQPTRILDRRYRSMLRDIARFRRIGVDLLAHSADLSITSLLEEHGFSGGFIDDYVLPMTGAVWSARRSQMREFPASTMLRFLANHGLIEIIGRPRWRTVSGGSRHYVEKLSDPFAHRVRLSSPVTAVSRSGSKVTVASRHGDEVFDHIVFATHTDQALQILGTEATPDEKDILGSLRYEPNTAYLHSDTRLMPRRKAAWSSWNSFAGETSAEERVVSVTYWMNRLQNLDSSVPVFVSLNPLREPDPGKVHGIYLYSHPQFDREAIAAQQALPNIQGLNRTWYAGAYSGYGFHEDGLLSGFHVAAALGSPPPWYDEVVPMSSSLPPRNGSGVTMRSALYRGRISHARLRPAKHQFQYRVFYGLFDLDELSELSRRVRWFSFNRFNVFSLYSSDHGPDDGTGWRAWVEDRLLEASVDLSGGRIELLAFPRVLGYVFNPISVWYCYGPDNELRAVLHEVRNTFGDKHTYVVPVEGGVLRHDFAKELHVSPFMDMDSRYHFSLTLPGNRVSVGIHQEDADGPLFRASLRATRLEFTDRNVLRLFFTHPLLTLKATTAIHWEALRLWRKQVPFHRRPEPKPRSVSIVGSSREAR